jgi:isopentenyl phosphate kinase
MSVFCFNVGISKHLLYGDRRSKETTRTIHWEIPHTWEVTSDTIAAYIAKALNAKELIKVTDVDGIYIAERVAILFHPWAGIFSKKS